METIKAERKVDWLAWQESQREGFSGIVTNPYGAEGYVSKVDGAFSFFQIGDGQDPIEVGRMARELHNLLGQDTVDAKRLEYLGNEVRKLSKPKVVTIDIE